MLCPRSCPRATVEGMASDQPKRRTRGGIRERGGVFQVRVHVGTDPVTGERVDLTGSATSEREAEKLLTRFLAEKDARRAARVRISFGEACDRWLVDLDVEAKTAHEYAGYVRRTLRPAFGGVPLARLDARRSRACKRISGAAGYRSVESRRRRSRASMHRGSRRAAAAMPRPLPGREVRSAPHRRRAQRHYSPTEFRRGGGRADGCRTSRPRGRRNHDAADVRGVGVRGRPARGERARLRDAATTGRNRPRREGEIGATSPVRGRVRRHRAAHPRRRADPEQGGSDRGGACLCCAWPAARWLRGSTRPPRTTSSGPGGRTTPVGAERGLTPWRVEALAGLGIVELLTRPGQPLRAR